MKEKLQELAIWVALIGFLYWVMTVEKERSGLDSEVKEFHGVIEQTWNKEFNQEKVLTAPLFD